MTTLTKEQIQSLRNQGQGTPQWSDETPTVITADKFVGDLEGNADTATHFKEPSRLTFTGDVSGQVNVYGSDASNVSIHVRQAENADHAEEAERAKSTTRARYADLANLATLAERATLATKTITSETATHAESSDTATTAERADLSTRALRADQANHATEADHSTTATTANRATNATNASHASEADHATSADTATSSARAGIAQIANIAKALDFTIIKVVTSYPETLTADALYVLVDNDGKIIGMDTKDKGPVDFDLMTIDVLTSISESTELKDGKLYAVPTEDGSGTKLDPRVANVIFKVTVEGVDVYYQVGGSGGGIVLPEASTSQKGIVQLTNTISNDQTEALTPKAVNDLKDTTFVTMSTAQYVYATKDELTNKSLSTAQYVQDNFVTLTTAQYVRALKTFNDVLPQTNLTPSDNKDMTSKIYVDNKVQDEATRADNKFVTLSTAQYIRDLKTFNDVLPQSNLTPSSDDDFATKAYVDSEVNKAKKEIGESVFSLVPLQNAGYHLYDGALISGSGSYAEFVSYIEQLYTSNPSWKCWTTEATWQSTVSTYGVCGKFVVDTTNHTVRLPKVTGIVEGTIDANALGDLVEAGIPNITGRLDSVLQFSATNTVGYAGFREGVNGAINVTTSSEKSNFISSAGNSTARNKTFAEFDASLVSSLYKNNFNKVQPQTIKGYYYIVLANVTKTEIQVDIDDIASDLNGKADKDLSNSVSSWSDTAKIAMAHMAMPSELWDNLTLGASGETYTAPADGYVHLGKTSSGSGQYILVATNSIRSKIFSTATGQSADIYVPVKKGQTFSVSYGFGGSTGYFRFVYAIGSMSEHT